jgi:F0F1-type ATP synthase membrane subunit b/b'
MSDFYKKYSEISNFKTAPFGYDKKDVAAYIKRLQSVLEDAKRTQRELQQQLDEERSIKLSIIQQKETTRLQLLELQKKLQEQSFSNPESHAAPGETEHLIAEAKRQADQFVEIGKRQAEQFVENAKRQAELLLADGKKQAEQIVLEGRRKADIQIAEGKQQADQIVADAKKQTEQVTLEVERQISDAQKQADRIIEDAKKQSEQALQKLDDAKKQAEELIEDAKKQAEEIVDDAEKQAKQLIDDANQQAKEVLDNAEVQAQTIINNATSKATDLQTQANNAISSSEEDAKRMAQSAKTILKDLEHVMERAKGAISLLLGEEEQGDAVTELSDVESIALETTAQEDVVTAVEAVMEPAAEVKTEQTDAAVKLPVDEQPVAEKEKDPAKDLDVVSFAAQLPINDINTIEDQPFSDLGKKTVDSYVTNAIETDAVYEDSSSNILPDNPFADFAEKTSKKNEILDLDEPVNDSDIRYIPTQQDFFDDDDMALSSDNTDSIVQEPYTFSFASDEGQQKEVFNLMSDLMEPSESTIQLLSFEELSGSSIQDEEMLQFIVPKSPQMDFLLKDDKKQKRNIKDFL